MVSRHVYSYSFAARRSRSAGPSAPRGRTSLRLILFAVLFALLSGCASMQREFADEASLLGVRGEPSRIWTNEDGTRTFEYATQPFGDNAWMYTIDGDGRIVEQFDALSRRHLARVQKGMTVAQVQRLLGQHRTVQFFALSGEEVYDWNIRNEWPDLRATRFNVHFVDGVVERTSQTFVFPRDGMFGFGLGFGDGPHPHWGGLWGWPHPRAGGPHYW